MRIVRRASLVFSLTLIVAISVGFVARSSELANERDLGLITSARLGASELDGVIRSVGVAASAGDDPRVVADALARQHRDLGVCVVAGDGVTACAGEGPRPTGALEAFRASDGDLGSQFTVYDDELSFTVAGDDLTILVSRSASLPAAPGMTGAVYASSLPPSDAALGGFASDGGYRQTASPVFGAPNLFAVATTDDSPALPADEQRFYVVLLVLAVVLLVLAGITLVVEHRSLVERASFDQLTRLPNRSEFDRRAAELLADAQRTGERGCLMMFDLNGFKAINDTYGHVVGDEMLEVIGHRLAKAVRGCDVVARWGGDEFVIMMPRVTTPEMGHRRAEELAEQLGGRTRLTDVDEAVRIGVSVGIALWPQHGLDAAELVDAADRAMYEAKREGVVSRVAETPEPVTLVPVG